MHQTRTRRGWHPSPGPHVTASNSSSSARENLLIFAAAAASPDDLPLYWNRMLKFLSKVRVEYNALDPRKAACVEILAQCNARKAKESNPSCQVELQRRTDDSPPRIAVTYVNGVEEIIDATGIPAQAIRQRIFDRGQLLETEQMFREAGEPWPVLIPEEEIHQSFPGTKPKKAEEQKQ
ncbi:hypothetical protein MUK42_26900 [Musa troglodytarum]|uniref:Large ribosomal subunit protein mL53 n=1 Tax=Musa troglodytarum TaxID=320322 RepID=A0A9E7F5K1_9LILI|nr:hypothetical protein MUK42_26900 [Musa troglodytarum]